MNKKVITISLEALISLAIILFSLHLTPVFANEEVIKDVVSGHIKGEIVIDFKDNIDENSEAFHKIITDYKIRPYYNSAYSKDSKLMLADVDEQHMDEILQALNKESFVESAEPNYVMFSFKAPNDPLYKYQWNMKKINLPAAWKYSTGKKCNSRRH